MVCYVLRRVYNSALDIFIFLGVAVTNTVWGLDQMLQKAIFLMSQLHRLQKHEIFTYVSKISFNKRYLLHIYCLLYPYCYLSKS